MGKDKATPGARQEFHFLFEESVQVERGGGGGLLREPIRSSQKCTMLLSSQARDSVGEEEKRRRNTGEMGQFCEVRL